MSTRLRPQPLTVRELVDLYYHFRLPELDPKSQTLSRRYLSCYCVDFGSQPVESLNKRELIAWLRGQDNWPAPSTKKSALNRIKAVFGWALKEDDLITRHPYASMGWDESDPRRSMTDDEYEAGWKAAPPIFRRLMLFLKLTGARPGEAAKLTYPMIDWPERIATIWQHKTFKKTGKPRVLYFGANCLELLRMLQAGPKHRKQGDLVFANSRGTRWTSCQMSTYWTEIREKARLPEDCLLYGLRHRLATRLALKYPMALVAKLMGHESIKTTAKYYTHLDEHRGILLDALATV